MDTSVAVRTSPVLDAYNDPIALSNAREFSGFVWASPARSNRTHDVRSRVAEALRLAARSLWHAQNYFGDLYRSRKARLGSPKAITAMARILWHLLKYKTPYNPQAFAKEEAKMKRQKLARLQTLAASLNYRLVPNQ